MSDHNTGHGHSDDGDGNDPAHGVSYGAGHEMDVPPTKELFNIVWGLGALTLLSLATCVQLFNNQQRDITTERGLESSKVLTEYRQGMDAITKTAGETSFKDSNGAEIKQRYVPLTVARELVLSKPDRLQATAPPRGWMHPDDIATGAQAGAAPTGGVVPTPANGVVDAPADGTAVPPADGAAAGTGTPAGTGSAAANPGTPEAPTGTLNPNQPGPIAPSRPGSDAPDATHSEPGAPAADPKVEGKTGAAGTGTTNPATKPATTPATTPATAPATGGKAAGDEGKSAPPQPAPTPGR